MEKLKIKLEKWVNGGYAIGHHDGHAVFVTGGIPGESVNITLEKQGKKEWFGTVIEVLEPSSERIAPDCEVYQSCGGCSFRHITYAKEIEIKKSLLSDMFPNESKWLEVISGAENFYRNNVQWQNVNKSIGFFSKQTHQVVEKSQSVCMNLDERLLWKNLDSKLKDKWIKQKTIHLRLSEQGIVNYEKDVSKFNLNGTSLQIPEKGFFQINRFLISPWIEKISSWLGDQEKVLELFCGSGTIGISLKQNISSLYGIEMHQKSIDFAKANAKANGVGHFTYEAIDLYQRPIPKSVDKYPTWIVNPPRAGLTPEIIKTMVKFRPSKIIYSSCNPSTLKRDIVELKKNNYKITKLVLLDFFPRTPHYEVLTCLERT
ncbi:class I SAM-dependent RNA methyltransferase [Leptospira ognonensis]|uniref:Class I SAM-dependent RNA methyltransferase n=1 Tax=Leptospira ognonensis TaxID=2484945 RepID=A0A4R9KAW8_9LEPT|nr:methyltransferase domain-containing protein [Leptospira ognonensis]TGL63141.1 class I SAM-dependent RNA methyltransferase [Leptospira ognonensis]